MKQEKLKTFVFENIDTHQSIIQKYEVGNDGQRVNIFYILEQHDLTNCQKIVIYHPAQNSFVPLTTLSQKRTFVSKQFLETHFIFIRFKKIPSISHSYPQNIEKHKKYRLDSSGLHKKKSKQRTIGQAIQAVKRWRQNRQHNRGRRGKKSSYKRSANSIGMSKKTLDDYYCQLRLGQQYQFNFEGNMDANIGVLRAFIKSHRPQKQQSDHIKYEKHAKNLKILEYYGIQNQSILHNNEQKRRHSPHHEQRPLLCHSSSQSSDRMPSLSSIEPEEPLFNNQRDNRDPNHPKQLLNIEYQFYRVFKTPSDEPKDVIDDMDEQANKDLYGNSFF